MSSSSSTAAASAPSTFLLDLSSPSTSNPWNDEPNSRDDTTSRNDVHMPLHTPDPSLLDPTITSGMSDLSVSEPDDIKPRVSTDVLSQFDPLASLEEQVAQNAWETSESHLPPPQPPSEPSASEPVPAHLRSDEVLPLAPSTPKESVTPTSATSQTSPPPSSSSPFPSLAALAKSFSIPTLSRSRPASLDAAKPVPSPNTLSAFALQQVPTLNGETLSEKIAAAQSRSQFNTPDEEQPSASTSATLGRDTEEAPFDFQKFLDQMKSRSSEPVSKYLRSFLSNFAKRTFTVGDQVKIINDFLNFIAVQMRNCDTWRNASDAEFDNAMEGMEKLVMNRLYDFTFTPQVAQAVPPRPITTDDLERDRVLSQRIALFGWIEEKHLDIPQGEGSSGFLVFAEQELLKLNHYKAPRDKLICILNCCKVIFGLLRHLKKEESADSFVPILIYVVLKANPDHLISNVEFISRFRNPAKLQSEAGYYLSSLTGAISFIETMDHSSLSNIDQEEFERRVEEAIQNLALSESQSPTVPHVTPQTFMEAKLSPHAGEESAQPLSLSTPSQTLSDDAKRLLQKTGDTLSKPLNAIGRIFSEALDGAEGKRSIAYLPGPFAPFELGREQRAVADQQQQPPPPRGSAAAAPSTPPWGVFPTSPWSPPDSSKSSPGPRPRTASPGRPAFSTPSLTPQTQQQPVGAYVPPPQIQTPYKPRVKRVPPPTWSSGEPSGAPDETPSRPPAAGPYTNQPLALGPSQPFHAAPPPPQSSPYGYSPIQAPTLLPPRVQSLAASGPAGVGIGGSDAGHISRTPTPSLDFAGVQAQIDAAHERAAQASRETLMQIFPAMEREIIELVLEANGGDLGKSIEALLEMSSGS